jgi:hypothetical protein
MRATALALRLPLAACLAPPDTTGDAATRASFACDGGRSVAVAYGTDAETPSATLTFDTGETALLLAEPTDRGKRYGWPSDGTTYVFLAEGQTATVLLKDGTQGGRETPVLTNCTPSQGG